MNVYYLSWPRIKALKLNASLTSTENPVWHLQLCRRRLRRWRHRHWCIMKPCQYWMIWFRFCEKALKSNVSITVNQCNIISFHAKPRYIATATNDRPTINERHMNNDISSFLFSLCLYASSSYKYYILPVCQFRLKFWLRFLLQRTTLWAIVKMKAKFIRSCLYGFRRQKKNKGRKARDERREKVINYKPLRYSSIYITLSVCLFVTKIPLLLANSLSPVLSIRCVLSRASSWHRQIVSN